jgi:hypothetical protein
MNNRCWILDREDTPQGLPLRQLIVKIREVLCPEGCQFLLIRSQGYGAQVCHWEAMLDTADHVSVSSHELERLTSGMDEWFYNLHVRCVMPAETIEFGLHDSTALFLDAPPALAGQITGDFKQVRVEQSPRRQ